MCAMSEFSKADLRLNEVYQELKTSNVNIDGKTLLINAQLAWIQFRDSNCEYAAERYQGGSIQPYIYYSCLTRLTQERIGHLESYFAA